MTQASPIPTTLSQLEPCLVVEDDTIINLDIEHTLRHLGLSRIHTATTIGRGAEFCQLADIRFAILDYELGHLVNSLPLAKTLADRGIPMIFLTAYGADIDLPEALAHVPVLSKPFTTAMLAKMLIDVASASELKTPQRLCG